MYDAAFGRTPGPGGYGAFVNTLLTGTTLNQAGKTFIASPAFEARYGAAPADAAVVDGVYQNTLHRAADAGGKTAYLDAFSNGLLSDTSAHRGSIAVLPGTIGL